MIFFLPLLVALVAAVSEKDFVHEIPIGVWPSTTYVTEHNISAPRLASTKLGKTSPGLLFIAPFGQGIQSQAPTIMKENGELVWQGRQSQTEVATNFDVQTVFGQDHLTYWSGHVDLSLGVGYGPVHILDNTYQEKYTICGANLGIVAPGGHVYPCQLDLHESFVTAENTLLATAYSVVDADLTAVGGSEGFLFDNLWFEIDIATNKVLKRWSAFENLKSFPLTSSRLAFNASANSLATPWDFFHINSVSKLGDGYLLCSRHFWEVIYINSFGKVEWILNGETGGDFTLPKNSTFRWQHHVRGDFITPHKINLHLFDNNDGFPEGEFVTSSGLFLTLNLETYEAVATRRLSDPQVKINSWHTGSVQHLPDDHVIVDYGQPPILQEFDKSGKLVWTTTFGTENGVDSYRAFKREWHATPAAGPSVLATQENDEMTVYVSWNGATEVKSWAYWAGHSQMGLRKVATVAKASFETKALLNGRFSFVQVEALDQGGKSLAFSGVVPVEGNREESAWLGHDEL